MVNKQVMGERRGREGPGEGRPNSPPRQAGFLEGSVQEKGHTGGTLSSGGSLEPRCLRNYLHILARLGLGALSCQVAAGECWNHRPLDGSPRTWSWHLCKSVQFVGFYLQAGSLRKQVRGDGLQEKFRRAEEVVATLAPPNRQRSSASCAQGPSLEAWMDGSAQRGVCPEPPKPLPADLPHPALVTTQPPPGLKGTNLSGEVAPSGLLGRQSLGSEKSQPEGDPKLHLPRPPPPSLAAEAPRGSQAT